MELKTTLDNKSLYDRDFYIWIQTTIEQLKRKQFSNLDLENLIEELADMGRSHKHKIESLLIRILEHLLKLEYWTAERERNANHWKGEIRTFRRQINRELKDSPSLKPYLREIFEECYTEARKEASDRSGLPIETFPATAIASLEQTLDAEWFPEL